MKIQKQPEFLQHPARKAAKEALIPTKENDYQPKMLQAKSLSAIVLALIMLKVFTTLFLFFTYPDIARLSSEIYTRIIELTNQTRTEEGVAPLNTNQYLIQAANAKAKDMFAKQYFNHDSPDGKKPWQWINKIQYDYTNAGENLAMNFTTANIAHLAFLKSPTHKKNIVNPKFNDIGVAVLSGKLNGKQTMLMVEMFGRQRGEAIAVVSVSEIAKVGNEKELKTTTSIVEAPKTEELKVPEPLIEESTKVAGVVKPVEVESVEIKKEVKSTDVQVVGNVESESNGEKSPLKATFANVAFSGDFSPAPKVNLANLIKQESGNMTIASTQPAIQEIIVKSSALQFKSKIINNLIKYSNYLFIAGLFFISLILVLNILIKIQIQHPVVIMQSLVAIAVIVGLVFTKFHFAQELATKVMIG